ncbi:hypothetical protein [Streptomyces sp. RKAG293]|uniref:hypothetical protein n=1 Tax=Streptomyces sp. RKAG293 TaxID=2893403 RepID=UPI002033D413|nr:hypothetical protein [Streptomyces sp. RKAG293]MCM2422632.1 hypothetical protein [Streptomyces sp. RKAG293]
MTLILLTACGGTDGKTEKDVGIASIDSPAASGATDKGGSGTPAASDAGRPQLRLDSSKEEVTRLWNAWAACLEQKGFHHFQDVIKDGRRVPVQEDPAYPAARQKCESKAPLGPPELDKDRNPKYADDWREWIDCMHRRKYMVIPLPNEGGYNFPDGPIPPNARQIEDECQMEAFGGKKK